MAPTPAPPLLTRRQLRKRRQAEATQADATGTVPAATPTFPDALERLVWGIAQLAVTAGIGWAATQLGVDLAAMNDVLVAAIFGILYAAVLSATVWLRKRLPFLPDPGGGLPGMPTGRAHLAAIDVEARLREEYGLGADGPARQG